MTTHDFDIYNYSNGPESVPSLVTYERKDHDVPKSTTKKTKISIPTTSSEESATDTSFSYPIEIILPLGQSAFELQCTEPLTNRLWENQEDILWKDIGTCANTIGPIITSAMKHFIEHSDQRYLILEVPQHTLTLPNNGNFPLNDSTGSFLITINDEFKRFLIQLNAGTLVKQHFLSGCKGIGKSVYAYAAACVLKSEGVVACPYFAKWEEDYYKCIREIFKEILLALYFVKQCKREELDKLASDLQEAENEFSVESAYFKAKASRILSNFIKLHKIPLILILDDFNSALTAFPEKVRRKALLELSNSFGRTFSTIYIASANNDLRPQGRLMCKLLEFTKQCRLSDGALLLFFLISVSPWDLVRKLAHRNPQEWSEDEKSQVLFYPDIVKGVIAALYSYYHESEGQPGRITLKWSDFIPEAYQDEFYQYTGHTPLDMNGFFFDILSFAKNQNRSNYFDHFIRHFGEFKNSIEKNFQSDTVQFFEEKQYYRSKYVENYMGIFLRQNLDRLILIDRRHFIYEEEPVGVRRIHLWKAVRPAQQRLILKVLTTLESKTTLESIFLSIISTLQDHIHDPILFGIFLEKYVRFRLEVSLAYDGITLRIHVPAKKALSLKIDKCSSENFAGTFPDSVEERGLYWGPNLFPLFEGFIVEPNLILGIQVTCGDLSAHLQTHFSPVLLNSNVAGLELRTKLTRANVLSRLRAQLASSNSKFSLLYFIPKRAFTECKSKYNYPVNYVFLEELDPCLIQVLAAFASASK